ncbi:MAG: hypothetical protein CMF45_08340 [Legionellales bacterium]|nr:hypothetical protein [Legionellales bacterium]|tara:strand:+ start:3984 stop:5009 length:1026 start_codon:yes stop_codon:yes gene_type:complete
MLKVQKYCPVCLGESLRGKFLGSSSTYSDSPIITLMINICGDCGSYYLKDYIEEKEIGAYYPSSYYTKQCIINEPSFKDKVRFLSYSIYKGYSYSIHITPKLYVYAIFYGIIYWHRLGRFPTPNKKKEMPIAVEIGFGAGQYLLDLKAMGWECSGIDADISKAKEFNKYGINVATDFKSLNFKANQIDYIYSYHALEHIYDIELIMENSYRILSRQGIFKLCVPVTDGLLPKVFKTHWYDLGVPIHKQIFSIRGIYALAERHDFKVVQLKFNSYSASCVGSIVAATLSLLRIRKLTAQELSSTKGFKLVCFFLSPIVFLLDIFSLGDRVEVVLKKKSASEK